jgi:hypothetical protein
MIYSEGFEALPAEACEAMYRRQWWILSGDDRAPTYAYLSVADRQDIIDIEGDAKKGLRAYYSEPSAQVR